MKIRRDPLDILFSNYIRLRDHYTCQRCGGENAQRYDAAHYITRRNHKVRYDPDNSVCLDFGCHSYFDQHPKEKEEFFRQRLGESRFEMLLIRAQATHPKIDRAAIRIFLNAEIKKLEGEH